MGGHSSALVAVAGRASFGPPPWASSRPGLPACSRCWALNCARRPCGTCPLGCGTVAGRGQHRKRGFWCGALRLGATQGSNDLARTASTVGFLRNAAEHPLASRRAPRRVEKGGSIGSYALRAFDDTRDLKDSRRRRNPALMAPRGTHQELETQAYSYALLALS